MIHTANKTYLPAAGKDWALPLYDPFVKLFGFDRVRRDLLAHSEFAPGQQVLDIGCGTGTFTVLIKQLHPEIEVHGLDPDPKALARAIRKANRNRLALSFDQGFSDRLPYADATFNHVFSSFMFHHLPDEASKAAMLREVQRVLKPGGTFQLMDFAGSDANSHGLVRLFHRAHVLRDNAEAHVLSMIAKARLVDPQRVSRKRVFLSYVAHYRAART
jgi:ubiquinone/menaquinone biosynthesis C-methylase UbiE